MTGVGGEREVGRGVREAQAGLRLHASLLRIEARYSVPWPQGGYLFHCSFAGNDEQRARAMYAFLNTLEQEWGPAAGGVPTPA